MEGDNKQQRTAKWTKTLSRTVLSWLPAPNRFRRARMRPERQVAALVDAFAAFATLDDVLSAAEADLILDMLRSAFPDVDHAWLSRRLRRAIKNPKPLQGLGSELRQNLDEDSKLAIGSSAETR